VNARTVATFLDWSSSATKGRVTDRTDGLFEIADRTIFLDEIGDLSWAQPKLLKVLSKTGALADAKSRGRPAIAATTKGWRRSRQGRFRRPRYRLACAAPASGSRERRPDDRIAWSPYLQ
jgi:DNA-binding NtrC family response regulator